MNLRDPRPTKLSITVLFLIASFIAIAAAANATPTALLVRPQDSCANFSQIDPDLLVAGSLCLDFHQACPECALNVASALMVNEQTSWTRTCDDVLVSLSGMDKTGLALSDSEIISQLDVCAVAASQIQGDPDAFPSQSSSGLKANFGKQDDPDPISIKPPGIERPLKQPDPDPFPNSNSAASKQDGPDPWPGHASSAPLSNLGKQDGPDPTTIRFPVVERPNKQADPVPFPGARSKAGKQDDPDPISSHTDSPRKSSIGIQDDPDPLPSKSLAKAPIQPEPDPFPSSRSSVLILMPSESASNLTPLLDSLIRNFGNAPKVPAVQKQDGPDPVG